jgi:protein-S-isoprenylcysteine O-methyltransferase Ste14
MASRHEVSTEPHPPSLEPMRWEGVGPRMGLAWMPWLLAAIGLRLWLPGLSAIPVIPVAVQLALGAVLLGLGLAFWAWSAAYFLRHFFAGRLLTSGPFAWCRNPIYASFIVLLLPAAALLANAWPLLVADVALYLIFRRFIGEEDRMLAERFGERYQTYRRHVGALVPVPPRHRTIHA